MSEKLKDPSKAAHEIVNDPKGDEDAIRHDWVRLTAANKNPWYVLATIHGEPADGANLSKFDKSLVRRNQLTWNKWQCRELSEECCKGFAKEAELKLEDLIALTDAEVAELRDKLRLRLNDPAAELPDLNQSADFSKTYFSSNLRFKKYIFGNGASFHTAQFRGDAYFSRAQFHGDTTFHTAQFYKLASFHATQFYRSSSFHAAQFQGISDFCAAQFSHSAVFNAAKFQSTTVFADTRFLTAVPEFHAAEIYDDTLFPTRADDVRNWPPLSGAVELKGQGGPHEVMDAADQKRTYNRLRLFMNRSLQIDEEQFFHRMEMRCKKEMAQGVHKWIYGAFETLSDFGISVKRPVGWLAGSIFAGTVVLMLYLGMNKHLGVEARVADGSVFWESLGWSISNSVPFLGYGKLYYGAGYAKGLPVCIKAMAGVQTLFGYIMLFFLGLGLRNRFRLR